jgi:copper chaperone CopZ
MCGFIIPLKINYYMMKTFFKLLAGLVIALNPLVSKSQEEMKKTATVRFLTSIECDNCVNRIMNNLPMEKGIRDVKCNLDTREVIVTYKTGKNDPLRIRKAIEKLGYTAIPVITVDTVKSGR